MNNKNSSDNKKRIFTMFICLILLIFTYTAINFKELIAVYNSEKDTRANIKDMDIALGGEAVGIKLLATGVLVMGVDRQDTDLLVGDIILSINDMKVESNSQVADILKKSTGDTLKLEISRNNSTFETNISPEKDSVTGEYKLGLWVKDSSAGVGTMTFYDKNTLRFASLGHGVTETKENYILPITSGGITKTLIYSIKRGEVKDAGELKGTLSNNVLGDIRFNSENGIYGNLADSENDTIKNKESIQILTKSKIKEGKASIFCTLDDNQVHEYEINIDKVLLTSIGNKNMIIKITDENLIKKTGGIVQGMSGSPIVQDGKLVGAITHVFLNDPTRGYGVFIENMIEDMSKMED